MKIKTNKYAKSAVPLALSAMLTILVISAASCRYNHAGTFQGNAEYKITTYEPFTEKTVIVEDMTFTLERGKTSTYVLKFGEKSPIQCSLTVDNRYYDSQGKGEETEDMNVDGLSEQACKVLDKDGNLKTARVSSKITGTLYGDKEVKRNYLQIQLSDGVGTSFKLTFSDGKRIS